MPHFARWFIIALCLWVAIPRGAQAQWAVIDVGAIAQLVQEGETLAQQLATAQQQLQQAQQQFQSLTGDRGMELLLAGTVRNYLPVNANELQQLFGQGATSYAALSAAMQSALGVNAVLTPQQIAALAPQQQSQLMAQRRAAAVLQALSADALSVTSNRFAALQSLIDTIGRATDPKAILDLQSRISAEQGMLQNEQTKLAVLYQAALGQQWANSQQSRESTVAGHGNFGIRFQPTP